MSIHTILGPMFCGKTSELHSLYKQSILAGNEALLISHAFDTRYSPHVPLNVSHDGVKTQCVRLNQLANVPPVFLQSITHIFIDEGQFFPDLVDFCLAQRKAGRHVVVAGLRSDASGNEWPSMSKLAMVHADKVTYKEATCIVCRGKAMYTRMRELSPRPKGGGVVEVEEESSKNQINIGSDEKYLPACFDHLFDPPTISSHILQERMLLLKKSKETLFY